MYKHLKKSMHKIFIQTYIIGYEKIFLLIENQRWQWIQPLSAHLRIGETESPTWASTTSILRLSIAISQAKGKLGKNTKVLQGTKGCRLKHKFQQQWTIISFLSILLCLQCIQRVPYIAFQWGNERSNPSDLKAYGRPRVKWAGSMSRKNPKRIWILHTSWCTWF